MGALLGTQEGREVEIVNSFELALDDEAQAKVDHGFLTSRRDQCERRLFSHEAHLIILLLKTSRSSHHWNSSAGIQSRKNPYQCILPYMSRYNLLSECGRNQTLTHISSSLNIRPTRSSLSFNLQQPEINMAKPAFPSKHTNRQ